MNRTIFIVMGVSGTGKTTIGKLLANKLDLPFFDGDDFHPKENVEKMVSGIPLNDNDRKGWLIKLNKLAISQKKGAIIACSALKEKYRAQLRKNIEEKICFIFLDATFEQIKERLEQRKNHYMPASLLQSQFDALEPPKGAIRVDVSKSPEEIIEKIIIQIDGI